MIVFIPLPVIWPGSSISTVRPTTNLSREQSFSKSFSKPEEFKNTFLGIGQKVWGGWIGAERVWVISFGAFGKGWAVQFSARRGWASCCFFLTGIGTHLTQSEVTPSSSKKRNVFRLWLKKYNWLVYNGDDNFMYCKICTKVKKSNRMSEESLGRNFQNTSLCRHVGLQGHQNGQLISACYLSPRVRDTFS